ncbi:M18 family aminopeptidase [Lagierella sp.]|uniref:M18 family aminopeptidase n=1 Tax=Lagierella sp. TaxID=2849657 RepID=UPI002607F0D5|nr:M18 family aminopeptidase [Lagierella sp.]
MNKYVDGLMEFIDKSPSVYHVNQNSIEMLTKKGFKELKRSQRWEIKDNSSYFTSIGDSAIIAFTTGKVSKFTHFNIVGSHSDSPTFKIKPNPVIIEKEKYIKLNTEVYGGPILSTWFDRPLSIAGRISMNLEGEIKSKLIDFKRPIITIPNLAIHMNREINKGYEYNAQKDTLPIMGLVVEELEKENFLLNLISKELEIDKDNILDFDLFLYDTTPGCYLGLNEEFYSIGRIDNLAMAYASLDALMTSKTSSAINMVLISNHEEIGSMTKEGADSPFLRDTLTRIVFAMGGDFQDFDIAIDKSFMISADQAHALHPNYVEKNDPTNYPIINEGPAIKSSARMSYTSDSISSGYIKQICKDNNIPCQYFVNRSDMPGGSTIGPINSSHLNIKSVDIGCPILGMHSIRELGGCKDQEYLYDLLNKFFEK